MIVGIISQEVEKVVLDEESYIAEESRLLATTYTDQDLMILMEWAQIRGEYEDVCNERNGAIIINANELTFKGGYDNLSPFRDAIYQIDGNQGYVLIPASKTLKIQLLQTYQINTIVFWIFDYGTTTAVNLKIDIVQRSGTSINIYPASSTAVGLHKQTFDAVFADQIIFTNTQGSADLNIIKIQAFYAF